MRSLLFSFFLSSFLITYSLGAAEEKPSAEVDKLMSMSLEDLLNLKVEGVSKKSENLKEVPMSVYVVSEDELNRWGVRNLYELTQRVPGYSFYNTDYYGQYGPQARGLQSIWRIGSSMELMPLVDFGHMTFTPQFFKSVEIARGPAGLTWGSAAEAGLINFNIRDDVKGVEAFTQIGDYKRVDVGVMAGGQLGEKKENNYFLGFSTQKQGIHPSTLSLTGQNWNGGLAENYAYNVLAKFQYEEVKFIYYKDHSNPIAPMLWFSDASLASTAKIQSVTFAPLNDVLDVDAYRLEYNVPIKSDIFKLKFYHDNYRKQWYVSGVAIDTQTKKDVGFSSQLDLLNKKLNLTIGGDLFGDDGITSPSFTSSWADKNLPNMGWYTNSDGTPILPRSYKYQNLYGQATYAVTDKIKLLLGARADSYVNKVLLSGPRTGIIYSPSDSLTLKYIFNSTNRFPTGNELSSVTFHVDPEKLYSHELMATYEFNKNLRIDTTLFFQKLSNELTRVNDPQYLNAYVNTGGIRTEGIEWALKYFPTEKIYTYWNASAQSAIVNSKIINGNEIAEAHNTANQALFVPRMTSFLGTEYGPIAGLLKINVALRSIVSIPYKNNQGQDAKASVNFVDLTLRTNKFLYNKLSASLVFLNLLNDKTRVPAYGEHSNNINGTLQPEGRASYLQLVYDL